MKTVQNWQKFGEWIGLVELGINGAFIEEGYAEIEIGKWTRCEGFEEDVYYDIGVIQVWVELISRQAT